MKVNLAKAQTVIDEAQKRCRERLLDAEDVKKEIAAAEQRLDEWGIAKKDWVGCRVMVTDGFGKIPNCYRGRPEATFVTVERFKTGWFVVCAKRAYALSSAWRITHRIMLTDAQKALVVTDNWQ